MGVALRTNLANCLALFSIIATSLWLFVALLKSSSGHDGSKLRLFGALAWFFFRHGLEINFAAAGVKKPVGAFLAAHENVIKNHTLSA